MPVRLSLLRPRRLAAAALAAVPVLANLDFGHTSPLATLPIGGQVELSVSETSQLRIVKH